MVRYYEDKVDDLRRLFGADIVEVGVDEIRVDGHAYPVVDDVILALHPARWPAAVRRRLDPVEATSSTPFAEDVQFSFGEEWKAHPHVLPEHGQEFRDYFDQVDLAELRQARVADLGCGNGRWATFVAPHCASLTVVDYSDAVFVARENLRDAPHATFVMADVLDLPFADDAFDFAYCLGVLHHLPVHAFDALRRLVRLSPLFLIYLYYALDNRPWYFRLLLRSVTWLRTRLSRVRSRRIRRALTILLTGLLYMPVSVAGRLLRPIGADRWLPLAEAYTGKTFKRLRQDAYDRFFTGIEQRFSRTQIESLAPELGTIEVSSRQPYWHFLIERTV